MNTIRAPLAAVLLLLIVNTPGKSQASGVHHHTSVRFGQRLPDQPPSILRLALAFQTEPDLRQDHRECISAIENVSNEADGLLGPATHCPFYPDINLQQVRRLEVSLTMLFRRHQRFADEAKNKPDIAKHLRKIENIRSEIDRHMTRIVSELQQRKSYRIMVHEQMRDIHSTLTRWRNECRKIDKAIWAA